jgi:filamentous hemagglutinin
VSGGVLSIQSGAINNTQGRIANTGAQNTSITATSLDSTSGLIVGQNVSLQLGTGALTNTNGTIYARADLNVQSGVLTNTNGTVVTAANAVLNTTAISSDAGLIQAASNLTINTNGGNFTNTHTTNTGVIAGGSLTIQAGAIDNSQGRIANTGNQSTWITATSFNSTSGLLVGEAVQVSTGTGQLTNANGTLYARGGLNLQSGLLDNSNGTLASAANVVLNTTAINNDAGLIQAASNLSLTTHSGLLTNTNTASKGIIASGSLNLDAGVVNNTNGTVYAKGDLTLQSGNLTNINGLLVTLANANLNTSNIDSTGGLIQATQNLAVQTNGGLLTNTNTANAGLIAGGQITIQSGAIDNSQGRIVNTGNQSTTITATSLNSTNGLLVGEALQISTGTGQLTNTNGTLYARGVLGIQSGLLTNNNGTLASNASAVLNTTGLVSDGGLVQATTNLNLNTNGGALTNTNTGNAGIVSGGLLTIQAGAVNNTQGRIASSSTQNTIITATSLDSTSGLIVGQNVSLQLGTGGLVNSNGTIYARSDLNLQSGNLDNTNGTVVSAANAVLNTTAISNDAGLIQAASNLSVNTNGGNFVNTHTANTGVIAGGQLYIQSGALDNSQGRIVNTGNQSTAITATSLDSTNGLLVGEAVQINTGAGQLTNANGTLYARGSLFVQSGALINTNGTLISLANANINTSSIDSISGLIQAAHHLTINTNGGAFNNAQTSAAGVIAGGNLSIAAGVISNVQGRIVNTGAQNTTIQATSLDSSSGLIVGEAMQISTGSGQLTNANGTLYARGALNVQSGLLTNNNGTIATNASAVINTTGLVSDGGLIQTAANLNLNTNSGSLTNTNTGSAGIVSGGVLSIQAGAINNTQGRIANTGNQSTTITATSLDSTSGLLVGQNVSLQLGTGTLVNTNGTVYARADLNVQSGNFTNTKGTVVSAANAVLNTAAISSDAGLIQAANNLTINTNGGAFNNAQTSTAGVIAGGQLTIQAGAINNTLGRIANTGAQNTAITATSLDSTSGLIVGQNVSLHTGSGALTNTNGTLYARGVLGIQSGLLTNNNGTLASNASAVLNTTGLVNDGGLIQTALSLNLTTNGGLLINTNTANSGIVSGGELTIQAGAINNTLGRIANSGALNTTITATSLDSTSGLVVGQNVSLQIGTGALTNTNGTVYARSDLSLQSGNFINTNGTVVSAANAVLNTTAISSDAGLIQAAANLTINTNGGNFVNTHTANAGVIAGGQLTIQSGALDNSQGRIVNTGNQSTTITATSLNSTNGLLVGEAVQINTGAGQLTNTNGTLYARGSLSVQSGAFDNINGTVASSASAVLNTADQYQHSQ